MIGNIEDAFVKIPDDTPHELEEDNLGYKNVVGAQGGLYINSALTFTLVGGSEAVDLSDGPVWVTGVGQPSSSPLILITQLNLGSVNSASPTKGHISELNVGLSPRLAIHGIFAAGAPAVVDVNNGVFKVGLLRNGSGVTIGSMGELTVESYSSIQVT